MGRMFACSDLHGRGDVWNKIKEYINDEDTLYVLGDVIDRGNDGWRIFKEAMTMDNVIYIPGNHDHMMYGSFLGPDKMDNLYNWSNNHCQPTLNGISDDESIALDLIKKLRECPLWAEYTNKDGKEIYLSHTGADPKEIGVGAWDDKNYFDIQNFVWDRRCARRNDLYGYDYVVHGHTPDELLANELTPFRKLDDFHHDFNHVHGELFRYWNNTKIDLDCGTYWYGYAWLLDLDTLEAIKIEGTEGEING